MICPFCASEELSVVKTIKDIDRTVRYRMCESCGEVFKTIERIATQNAKEKEQYLREYNEIYKD